MEYREFEVMTDISDCSDCCPSICCDICPKDVLVIVPEYRSTVEQIWITYGIHSDVLNRCEISNKILLATNHLSPDWGDDINWAELPDIPIVKTLREYRFLRVLAPVKDLDIPLLKKGAMTLVQRAQESKTTPAQVY